MWWAVGLAAIVGVLFGSFITIGSAIMYDKNMEKHNRELIQSPEEWCMEGCKYWEECMKNHDDPDEAMDDLMRNHCECRCPVYAAQEVLDR